MKRGLATLSPSTPLRAKQVEEFLVRGIDQGLYPIGSRLPSVAQMVKQTGYAPKTVHKAYRILVERGVLESFARKGYYVASTDTGKQQRIFLLLDNYSPYKQSLFQTIKKDFGAQVDLTVHFHFYDPDLFRRYIAESFHKYTHYIVSSFFMEDLEEVLALLPPDRLYLLGRHPRSLKQEYHGVFQDFFQDVIRGLTATGDRMWKYERLALYFRDSVTQPPLELLNGFVDFCKDRKIDYRLIRGDEAPRIHQGEGYLLIDDADLIAVVRLAHEKGYVLGKDIGVISYNDTPIKSIISTTGVSVLSTDFQQMGHSIVEMVCSGQYSHLINPARFIDRHSF